MKKQVMVYVAFEGEWNTILVDNLEEGLDNLTTACDMLDQKGVDFSTANREEILEYDGFQECWGERIGCDRFAPENIKKAFDSIYDGIWKVHDGILDEANYRFQFYGESRKVRIWRYDKPLVFSKMLVECVKKTNNGKFLNLPYTVVD